MSFVKKNIFILFILIVAKICFSQENQRVFTLEQAIDYALSNSVSIQNADLDIQAAIKQKWETTAMGLPQVSAAINYQNNIKRQFDAVDFNLSLIHI